MLKSMVASKVCVLGGLTFYIFSRRNFLPYKSKLYVAYFDHNFAKVIAVFKSMVTSKVCVLGGLTPYIFSCRNFLPYKSKLYLVVLAWSLYKNEIFI